MSAPAARVEVLIIGAGVIGNSIAYHVARQRRSVLVVERQDLVVEPAASWASAGGVRLWEQDPGEAALAHAALARWPALAEELNADLQYCQAGHLLVAENEVEANYLQTVVQRQHDLGFVDVSLVDRQEVLSVVPGLGEQVTAGIFSPTSGHADPRLTTRAFANAAKRHGARYWTTTECHALERVADRVTGAQTSRGLVRAEQIVLATGAWSQALAGTVGLQVPLRMRVLQVLLSSPAPRGTLMPVVSAVGRALSLRQRTDGALVLGGGWLGDPSPDGRSYRLRTASQQGNWTTACELFPAVRTLQCVGAWGGLQAHTPDDLPYIGSFSGLAGLTLAYGSWYGFALAPAIGSVVADHLAGRPTPQLDRLSPDRIARFDRAQVAAFLAAPVENVSD